MRASVVKRIEVLESQVPAGPSQVRVLLVKGGGLNVPDAEVDAALEAAGHDMNARGMTVTVRFVSPDANPGPLQASRNGFSFFDGGDE